MNTSVSQSVVFNGHLLLKEQANLLAAAMPSDINYSQFLSIKRNAQQRRTAQLNYWQKVMSEREARQTKLDKLFKQKVETEDNGRMLDSWNNHLEFDKGSNQLSSTSHFALPATLNERLTNELSTEQSPEADNMRYENFNKELTRTSNDNLRAEVQQQEVTNQERKNQPTENATQLQCSFDDGDSLCYGDILRNFTNELDLSLQSKHITQTDSVTSVHSKHDDNGKTIDIPIHTQTSPTIQTNELNNFSKENNTAVNRHSVLSTQSEPEIDFKEEVTLPHSVASSRTSSNVATGNQRVWSSHLPNTAVLSKGNSNANAVAEYSTTTVTTTTTTTTPFASAISNNYDNVERTSAQIHQSESTVKAHERESFDETPAVAVGKAQMYHERINIESNKEVPHMDKKLWRADELIYNDDILGNNVHGLNNHEELQQERQPPQQEQEEEEEEHEQQTQTPQSQLTQQPIILTEEEEVKEITVLPCPCCGRTFIPERLLRHQHTCERQKEMENRRRTTNKLNKSHHQLSMSVNNSSNNTSSFNNDSISNVIISSRQRQSAHLTHTQREAMSSAPTTSMTRSKNTNHSEKHSANLQQEEKSALEIEPLQKVRYEHKQNLLQTDTIIHAHNDEPYVPLEAHSIRSTNSAEKETGVRESSLHSNSTRNGGSKSVRHSSKMSGTKASLPCADDVGEDGRILCVYCGRRFAPSAAERHIPFCKTKHTRKEKT